MHTLYPVVTGAAIPDATAQRLYFVSLANLPTVEVANHFRFNLGFQDADVASAVNEIAEFKRQYEGNTAEYNGTVGANGVGFKESLRANFRDRQTVITSDTLGRMEGSLSRQAFMRVVGDIQSAKRNMGIATPAASNPMGCCYNYVITDTSNILSTSPFHATWTHQLTVEGSASGAYPGVTHYSSISISANGHTFSGSSPRVSPSTYIDFSGSVTLDSNNDPCLTQDQTCAANDTGNVICSASGLLFLASIRELTELAWTQVIWGGTPPPTPTGCSMGDNYDVLCVYSVYWNCTAATTPPDYKVTAIRSGTNYVGMQNVTWTAVTLCGAIAVNGTQVTPYVCLGEGGSYVFRVNSIPPPYECTAKNLQF